MADNVYPPDYQTAIGQVRSLIPDVELLENPADLSAAPEYIFDDATLQAYLALARDNVYRAAAIAVNTLATSEALILKVLKSDDRQTDGAKLADSLGRRAQWLDVQADEEDAEVYGGFDIVPYDPRPVHWEYR